MNDTADSKVTLILPVRRAEGSLKRCLRSVMRGPAVPQIMIMDCTGGEESSEGIWEWVRSEFPQVRIVSFGCNPGRAHAVNTGIHLARTPFVMTLSPRLIVGRHCIERLLNAILEDGRLFSVQAGILSAQDPERLSGAGWNLTLGAEPVIMGSGAKASAYLRRRRITAAQMDAAVYRMEYLEMAGILDERFYSRLEDLDLGYRAELCGVYSICEPSAVCREMEAAAKSAFYDRLEIGNMEYFRYKHGLEPLKQRLEPAMQKLRQRFGRDAEDEGLKEAVERGRMMSFQAEMELMERDELGMSVTKQTLPEEFCMSVRDERLKKFYPLYLGERGPEPDLALSERLGIRAGMLAGTMEQLRKKAALPE